MKNGPVASVKRGGAPGVSVLLMLCAIDAAIQVLALAAPHPTRGMGVIAFAFLPAILSYHAVLWMAIAAGMPLAVACIWRGGGARMVVGLALAVLTVANAVALFQGLETFRTEKKQQALRDKAIDVEVAKCTAVMAKREAEIAAYFSEPRKIVTLGGPYTVTFDNGMQVSLPPVEPPHPPQAFREFFYDHLVGSTVRVARRPLTAGQLGERCRLAGGLPATHSQTQDGDVFLLGRKIDAAAYLDRGFPRPQTLRGGAPSKYISRWFNAHTGDRTYAPAGVKPDDGYVVEGTAFALLADPDTNSLDLYLCNAPLQRPSSPEHFLSTDRACEGQKKVALLGHIRSSRDGQAVRALLRCVGTVQSALRTGPRSLATPDVLECRDHSIEIVLGFVAG